jgi:hypothetical protein
MRGRDRARILAPAVLGGWLTGCFGVGWQTIYSSVPRLEPSEAWSQTGDDEFTTTGMKVRIWAHNVVFGREWGAGVVFLIPIPLAPGQPAAKPPRPFRIQLIFHVETEDFTFDAGRVTLASERLPPMTPTREVEQVIRLEPHPYPSSIYVSFDIDPPDAEREFTLLLDGLARGGLPLPPLRIRFKPSQRTRFEHDRL